MYVYLCVCVCVSYFFFTNFIFFNNFVFNFIYERKFGLLSLAKQLQQFTFNFNAKNENTKKAHGLISHV